VAFLRRARRFFFLAWLVGAGCSLALDTDSLQQPAASGAGGSGGASQEAGSESGTPDGAIDAPTCPEPGPDPCAQCQATYCCPESNDCAHETRCNLAMVALQQCRHDARLGDNSRVALAACNAAFVQNGGPRAMTVLTCMASRCVTSCGGG
jgi:hypothetical protein